MREAKGAEVWGRQVRGMEGGPTSKKSLHVYLPGEGQLVSLWKQQGRGPDGHIRTSQFHLTWQFHALWIKGVSENDWENC